MIDCYVPDGSNHWYRNAVMQDGGNEVVSVATCVHGK